jgi:hypothetical protein
VEKSLELAELYLGFQLRESTEEISKLPWPLPPKQLGLFCAADSAPVPKKKRPQYCPADIFFFYPSSSSSSSSSSAASGSAAFGFESATPAAVGVEVEGHSQSASASVVAGDPAAVFLRQYLTLDDDDEEVLIGSAQQKEYVEEPVDEENL